MDFRHEVKHEINLSDMMVIRSRLKAAAYSDEHAIDGKYLIRSLYFDNLGLPDKSKLRLENNEK